MKLHSYIWQYLEGAAAILLPTAPRFFSIGFLALSLWGCAGINCCISITNDSEETIRYLVIGIGIVTVPKSAQTVAATVTKLNALGVAVSNQPGLVLGSLGSI